MGLDVDVLAKGALIAIGLLALIVSWRRRSAGRDVFTIQGGDTTQDVAYVARGGQVHVASDRRRGSAPLTRGEHPPQLATNLAMALHAAAR